MTTRHTTLSRVLVQLPSGFVRHRDVLRGEYVTTEVADGYVVGVNAAGERRLSPTGPWTPAASARMDRGDITDLSFNPSKGFDPADLEFLEDWPLTRLHVLARRVDDATPIERLGATLETLDLADVARGAAPVDLQRLPGLTRLTASWPLVEDTLDCLPDLQALQVFDLEGRDLRELAARAPRLEWLRVAEARELTSLDGLGDLPDLRWFASLNGPGLQDVGALAATQLWSISLRDWEGGDAVAALTDSWGDLRSALLSPGAPIASLRPVAAAQRLVDLRLGQETSVWDGDAHVLLDLPRLRTLLLPQSASLDPHWTLVEAAVDEREPWTWFDRPTPPDVVHDVRRWRDLDDVEHWEVVGGLRLHRRIGRLRRGRDLPGGLDVGHVEGSWRRLQQLVPRLRAVTSLTITDYPGRDLRAVAALAPRLRSLDVTAPGLRAWTGLASLSNCAELTVRRARPASLGDLPTSAPKLERFGLLDGSVVEDRQLWPLVTMPSLRSVRVADVAGASPSGRMVEASMTGRQKFLSYVVPAPGSSVGDVALPLLVLRERLLVTHVDGVTVPGKVGRSRLTRIDRDASGWPTLVRLRVGGEDVDLTPDLFEAGADDLQLLVGTLTLLGVHDATDGGGASSG